MNWELILRNGNRPQGFSALRDAEIHQSECWIYVDIVALRLAGHRPPSDVDLVDFIG